MGSLTIYRAKYWPDSDSRQRSIPVSNRLDGSSTNTLYMVDYAQQKKVGDFRLDGLSTELTTMGSVVPLLSQREPVRVSSCEQSQNKHMNCTDRTLLRAESHLGGLIEYAHRHQIKGNERHTIETDSIVIFFKTLEGSISAGRRSGKGYRLTLGYQQEAKI